MNSSNRGRLLGMTLAAAIAIGLQFVAPEIYTATFSDVATFMRVAALVAVLVGWVVVVRRIVPGQAVGMALAVGPVAVVAALVIWPYLRPATKVDEAFPVATTDIAADTSSTTTSSAPPASTTVAPDSTSSTSTTNTTSSTTSTTSTTTSTTTTTSTVPPEPVELRRSTFQGLTGHRGSGDAVLYRLADDTTLLRFEEIDIGSGPNLNVYLVPGSDQRSLADSIHVAELTAEQGNQNYTIPDGVDLGQGTWTVLVWCETFVVEVANATFA